MYCPLCFACVHSLKKIIWVFCHLNSVQQNMYMILEVHNLYNLKTHILYFSVTGKKFFLGCRNIIIILEWLLISKLNEFECSRTYSSFPHKFCTMELYLFSFCICVFNLTTCLDDISRTSVQALGGVICIYDIFHTWVQALLHFKCWKSEPVTDQLS